MKRRLTRIDPLSCGKILAALHGTLSLLFIPLFLLFAVVATFAPHTGDGPPPGLTVGLALVMAVVMPIMYAIMGFLIGLLGAFVYNLAAKHLGGIEVEVE